MQVAEVFHGMLHAQLRPRLPTTPPPAPGWKELMEACWATDPVERPDCSQVADTLAAMWAASGGAAAA
jgi:hypothetical protein